MIGDEYDLQAFSRESRDHCPSENINILQTVCPNLAPKNLPLFALYTFLAKLNLMLPLIVFIFL